MGKVNNRFIIMLLLTYVLSGIAGGLFLYYVLPEHYFGWYPVIPSYFTVLGVILYLSLIYYKKKDHLRMINVYMMMRGIKLLLTILSVLMYDMFVDESDYDFSIVTVFFYLYYLFIETYFYIKFEISSKKNGAKN